MENKFGTTEKISSAGRSLILDARFEDFTAVKIQVEAFWIV